MEKIDEVLSGLELIQHKVYDETENVYGRELLLLCREYTDDIIALLNLMKQYRLALISNVLQHYVAEGKLCSYCQGAGERTFKALGLEDGESPEELRKELYGKNA